MDNTLDTDDYPFTVHLESEHMKTYYGARGSCGEPEEPDTEIWGYRIERVTLGDVDITHFFETSDWHSEDDIYEVVNKGIEEMGE